MTGCTPFMVNLVTTAPHKLVKADPVKLASKYGLDYCPRCGGTHGGVEWVRMSLAHHGRRG